MTLWLEKMNLKYIYWYNFRLSFNCFILLDEKKHATVQQARALEKDVFAEPQNPLASSACYWVTPRSKVVFPYDTVLCRCSEVISTHTMIHCLLNDESMLLYDRSWSLILFVQHRRLPTSPCTDEWNRPRANRPASSASWSLPSSSLSAQVVRLCLLLHKTSWYLFRKYFYIVYAS